MDFGIALQLCSVVKKVLVHKDLKKQTCKHLFIGTTKCGCRMFSQICGFYRCMGSTAARGDVTLQEELYLDVFLPPMWEHDDFRTQHCCFSTRSDPQVDF